MDARELLKVHDRLSGVPSQLLPELDEEPSATNLPDTLEASLDELIPYQHISSKRPVHGLGPMARQWVDGRTAFRWDVSGRVFGADLVWKPRKGWFTSTVFGAMLDAMLRWEAVRCLTIAHQEEGEIGTEFRRLFRWMAEHLPEELTGGVDVHEGQVIFRRTGSRWGQVTAGRTEEVADATGRGGPIDFLHLTEAGMFARWDDTVSAAMEACAPNASIVAESSSARSRTHGFSQAYFATIAGEGQFLRAWFFPWFAHPIKRLPAHDRRYAMAMSQQIPPAEVEREASLGLDHEQRAWRRWNFFRGTQRQRQKKRRENPETVESVFAHEATTYLDPSAIERARASVREPIERRAHTRQLEVRVYAAQAGGFIVAGADTHDPRALVSRDYCGIEFGRYQDGEQLAEIGGRGTDSEMADAIVWALIRLQPKIAGPRLTTPSGSAFQSCGLDASRYCVVTVERNKGGGLIAELARRRVPLWHETGSKLPGVYTGGHNRPRFIDLITEAVEGAELEDEFIEPVVIRSGELLEQLGGLAKNERGKVEAGEGYHDDLVLGYGIMRYTQVHMRPPVTADWGNFWAGKTTSAPPPRRIGPV